VLYGAAEFSRDLDLALLPDPANLDRLRERFGQRASASGTRKTAQPRDEREIRSVSEFRLSPSGSFRARAVFLAAEPFALHPRRFCAA